MRGRGSQGLCPKNMQLGGLSGNRKSYGEQGVHVSEGIQCRFIGCEQRALMQESISRQRSLHWGVKKVGNDLRRTPSITINLGQRGRTRDKQIQTAPKER